MSDTPSSVLEEIDLAHQASLDRLDELSKNAEFRPMISALRRYVETWELRLLTSRVGVLIESTTLSELNGALAATSDMRSLFTILLSDRVRPSDSNKTAMTDKLFVETLFKDGAKPTQ